LLPEDHVPSSRGRQSQAIFPTDEIVSQFEHKLHRYLSGRGHPTHVAIGEEFVSREEHIRDAESNTLRARKFLRFATGSELMPHGQWKVRVRPSFFHVLLTQNQYLTIIQGHVHT
jgi:hypothetical protein